MQELVGLLAAMEHHDDYAGRVSIILAWTLRALPLEGIAVLESEAAPSEGLGVMASLGSLTAIADSLASSWSPTGMPQKQCLLALPAGMGPADVVLVLPLNFRCGVAWTALVLQGTNVEEALRTHQADMLIVSLLLRDAVENQGMKRRIAALVSSNTELKDRVEGQELLTDRILSVTKMLQRTQGAAIRSLARLAEYRDPETGFHLQRICEYTRLLALEVFLRSPFTFRITREYGDDISVSSMLHDIGKVSIPDSILLKPGKLDAGEWEMMKKHTIFGWEVLHKADTELGEQSFLTLAATIALSHHEKYDGSGYPHGTAGEKIPLSARMSAMADVYDALTTARPYKEAWTHERAMEEIIRQSGAHFDPALVEIFRDINGAFAAVRRQFPG